MLSKQTLEKMTTLRLHTMAQSCQRLLESPESSRLTAEEIVGLSVDAEYTERQNKRLKQLLKKASLADNACMEDIEYSSERGLDKTTMARLAEGIYIREQNHILVTGKTGCGKTFVICALGQMACRRNIPVYYIRVPKLLIDMNIAKQEGTYSKFLTLLRKATLLILDDWGLIPFTEEAGRDLLEIAEERYRNGSMIIASQLPVANWYDVFPDPTIADACLDRILHKSYRIEMKGGNMRKKKSSIRDEKENLLVVSKEL